MYLGSAGLPRRSEGERKKEGGRGGGRNKCIQHLGRAAGGAGGAGYYGWIGPAAHSFAARSHRHPSPPRCHPCMLGQVARIQ